MNNSFLFTSESVSEGHPDKLADQISDGILDALLINDPNARVACETFIKMGLVLLGGEITTNAWVDTEELTRQILRDVGYVDPALGLDAQSCAILTIINKQSPDIARGLNTTPDHEQGAGDQGIVFGYATNETSVFMPAPILYAHKLMYQQALLRKNNVLPWLGPDAKSQVTLLYENQKPIRAETIVISTQHSPSVSLETLTEAVIEEIIKPVIPKEWLTKHTRYLINPTGRFVMGGPAADCGLTGRKIIVDTYGGMARHGGGAFSGKDPSKVDRSAAYMARYIAKNMVAAGLAERLELQIAYAIGVAEPVSIYVETFGTGKLSNPEMCKRIRQIFDLRPRKIIETLALANPIYAKTACYGHFGREEPSFSWEKTDKILDLQDTL